MKRKAHGAQEPRHIQRYVEVTSAAQRSDSPAQTISQRFLSPNDAAIAEHAVSIGAVLVTNNTREFQRVHGLYFEDWAT
jgi:predicted nucleic acid-binding protein